MTTALQAVGPEFDSRSPYQAYMSLWPNGQGVPLLRGRLRVQVPSGMCARAVCVTELHWCGARTSNPWEINNRLSGSIPPFTRMHAYKYIVVSGGGCDLLRFRPKSVPRSLYCLLTPARRLPRYATVLDHSAVLHPGFEPGLPRPQRGVLTTRLMERVEAFAFKPDSQATRLKRNTQCVHSWPSGLRRQT